ncbi:MAG: hypothetical protein MJ135_01090 [Oscillospiraceae bacterium]|nr:hypothetical protein [Oscillospiraceae bacterium]
MLKHLRALIPAHVSGRAVLRFFEVLRRWHRLWHRHGGANLLRNRAALAAHLPDLHLHGGYVEDQHQWCDTAYGRFTMSYSGCEVFAFYNALVSVGMADAASLPELIEAFERDGMVLRGRFGTSPRALLTHLKRYGLGAELSTRVQEFESIARRSASLILTLYNDGCDICKQVHTVCITKEADGYLVHNLGGNGTADGPYPGITPLLAQINGGRAKAICLLGITKQ